MQKAPSPNRIIAENLLWLLGSLALAFFVWVIATMQLDPVEQWRVREPIAIRVSPDPGLVIANEQNFSRTASVLVRSQRSVRELLAADDIVVWADLTGLGPGEHVVELQAEVARRARVVDISPRQITVRLEEEQAILVPVRAVITGEPASGYAVAGEPTFDIGQVTVSGPTSQVEQVAAAQVEIDVSGQVAPFEDDTRPVPVDADGNIVQEVTVDTQVIRAAVDVVPADELETETP